MQVLSLGWEDPLEEGMATHSSITVWRIPRTEEPGGLQSIASQRVRHDWSNLACTHAYSLWRRKVEDNEGAINSPSTPNHPWATNMPGVAMWERWLLPRTKARLGNVTQVHPRISEPLTALVSTPLRLACPFFHQAFVELSTVCQALLKAPG